MRDFISVKLTVRNFYKQDNTCKNCLVFSMANSEDLSSSSEAEQNEIEIDASETESDEDGDNESDEDEDDGSNSEGSALPQKKTRDEFIHDKILKKYDEIKGKQLYVRFPQKLPLDEKEFQEKAMGLSDLIVKGHKPRQKHARFCLVDFKSQEDRDAAHEAIGTAIKDDPIFKGIVVALPKTESEEFVNELVERKQKSVQNKKAKNVMKRASKQAQRAKNFTSSVVIINLPKASSLVQVRKLFPNAVDVQIKQGKGKRAESSIATITLPTTLEARAAVKESFTLDGTKLIVRFNKEERKRKRNKHSKTAIKRKAESNTVEVTKLKSKKQKVK